MSTQSPGLTSAVWDFLSYILLFLFEASCVAELPTPATVFSLSWWYKTQSSRTGYRGRNLQKYILG
jgi:hypothetical protein